MWPGRVGVFPSVLEYRPRISPAHRSTGRETPGGGTRRPHQVAFHSHVEIKPLHFFGINANDQVFLYSIARVILSLGMKINRISIESDLHEEFWCSREIIILQ